MADLKLADPERILSLSYVPRALRPALEVLWLLDEQLGASVARTENPAVGQMRLTWWHEALRTLRTTQHADPLLIGLAQIPDIDPEQLLPLIDGWEALLDPLPLEDDALRLFAQARGATLFRAAGRLLGSEAEEVGTAGELWALTDLAFRVSDTVTADRALSLARMRIRPAHLPGPLAMLAALARRDVRRGLGPLRRQGSPARVARAMLAGLTGR